MSWVGKTFVLVADGDLTGMPDLYAQWQGSVVVALDGAAEKLLAKGYPCDVVLGDFDSLPAEVATSRGLFWPITEDQQSADGIWWLPRPDQQYTDLHKAIMWADEQQAGSIEIHGASGDRLDHMLWSIRLLKNCYRYERPLLWQGKSQSIRYIQDQSITITACPGSAVGLLACADTALVTTQGLAYDLTDYLIEFGKTDSVANRMLLDSASISVAGGVLVISSS